MQKRAVGVDGEGLHAEQHEVHEETEGEQDHHDARHRVAQVGGGEEREGEQQGEREVEGEAVRGHGQAGEGRPGAPRDVLAAARLAVAAGLVDRRDRRGSPWCCPEEHAGDGRPREAQAQGHRDPRHRARSQDRPPVPERRPIWPDGSGVASRTGQSSRPSSPAQRRPAGLQWQASHIQTMTLQTGARLGAYEIRGPLGAGGMGEVYRAWDARLGREVAVKVLPQSAATNPDRLRRFEQEAKAAGALNHPNVLAVYDVGSHESSSLHRLGAAGGRHAARADPRRRADPAQGRRARHPDRARSRRRAPAGDRPPRPEAGERLRHPRRPREDPGLRPRQAARRGGERSGGGDGHPRDPARRGRGHGPLPLARAGARPAGGRPLRHLRARLGALRDAGPAPGLHRRDDRGDRDRHPPRGAAGPDRDRRPDPRRPRPGRPPLPGEAARGSIRRRPRTWRSRSRPSATATSPAPAAKAGRGGAGAGGARAPRGGPRRCRDRRSPARTPCDRPRPRPPTPSSRSGAGPSSPRASPTTARPSSTPPPGTASRLRCTRHGSGAARPGPWASKAWSSRCPRRTRWPSSGAGSWEGGAGEATTRGRSPACRSQAVRLGICSRM